MAWSFFKARLYFLFVYKDSHLFKVGRTITFINGDILSYAGNLTVNWTHLYLPLDKISPFRRTEMEYLEGFSSLVESKKVR